MKHTIDRQRLKKRILPTLLISALLPLVLCISTPIDLYSNNYNEFYFIVADFLPFCLLFAFVSLVVLFFILFFLPNKPYKIVSAIIISIAFLFFIQSNFLNGELRTLNGDNIGSNSVSVASKVVNIIIWVAVIALAVVLACLKDKRGIISTISVVISIALLSTHVVTPVVTAISKRDVFLSKSDRVKEQNAAANHYIITTENLDKVYTESNIYYFVVDRFDEDYAETLEEKMPGIYDNLTGFTWYQDNISLYGHTYPAIANMLTCKDFDPALSRNEYLNSVYEGDNPLRELHENGYEINVYTQEYYAYSDAYYLPECVENRAESDHYKISSYFMQSMSLIGMGLYRAAPFFVKDWFFLDSSHLNKYVEEYDSEGNIRFSNSNNFIEEYINDPLSLKEGKGFHFIHLDGLHSWNISSSHNQSLAKTSFDFINKFVDYLKANDLYEESTIIITGDHGKPASDRSKMKEAILTALFVKKSGVGEGAIQKSSAQTSHENIWATIMSSADIKTETDYGKSVFDISETENVSRRHFWHTYYNPFITYEYKIDGVGTNFDTSWHLVSETNYTGRTLLG